MPDTWEIVRLDEVCDIKGGKRIPSGSSFSDIPTPHIYLRVTDMKENTILDNDLKFIDESIYVVIKNYTISKDDLYLTIAGTIGSVGIIPEKFDGMNLTENAAKLTNISVDKEYLMYALLATSSQEHFSSKFHQVAQPKLSIETASSTPIPIPPYPEQLRIVQYIKNVVCSLGELEKMIQGLGEDVKWIKSKILDLAMQGKLVSQDPADESASDMLRRINPKAEIITDNPHYPQLPDNWIYCLLGTVIDICSAKRIMKSDWQADGIPFYRTREIVQLANNGYIDNSLFISPELYESYKSKYGVPSPGDIMLTAVGTIGKTYIVQKNDTFYYKDASVLCLTPSSAILSKFVELLFQSPSMLKQIFDNSKGTTVDTITIEKANSYIIGLPPLAEQQRIIEKIANLYSILDEIEASLQA